MIDFIKDADCTKETPVKLGVPDAPIYGKGIKLKPRVDGRTDSEHFKKIYLPELLPLEEYDLIVVLISGGKDSVACYLKLLELGVPKERIEFWHHDIDGGHPSRRMDWKCTQNYVKALADAEGIKLRVSYRVNGFFGELYRIGASEPITQYDGAAQQTPSKSVDEVAQDVVNGKYGNGADRKAALEAAGYNYDEVQAKVNEILGVDTTPKKSVDEIAQEVINGAWGNGQDRKNRIEQAGYDYTAVQNKVNELCGTPKKSIDEIARAVIRGEYGNGADRKNRITTEGYDYAAVQARVNDLM